MHPLAPLIESAYETRDSLTPESAPAPLKKAVDEAVALLDNGTLRVAEKINGEWHTHAWLKKAVMLYFRLHPNQMMDAGWTHFYDKVPVKFAGSDADTLKQGGVRIVPPAVARFGAYIAPNTILMPSYTNIGAYIDSGTMIDTWATIGSCVQIGKNVHISGGVGIGGVLEPAQATPTIIEDDCFIGARSEVVEGVIVEAGSVISMGVYIGQSTRIYHRESGTISYGKVPAGSVVVPGSLPAPDGKYSLYCAVIVKQVDAQTRSKTTLNALLRDAMETASHE